MDIVKRLRSTDYGLPDDGQILNEAADEIVRLRGGLETANQVLREAERERNEHRKAAHEADMRTQAAVRGEKEALASADRMRGLIAGMQCDAVKYLEPAGLDAEQFVSRILEHLDGPAQREALSSASHSLTCDASTSHYKPCSCGVILALPRTDDLSALAAHDAEVRKAALLDVAANAEQHIDYPIDKEDEEFNGHLAFMVKQLRRMAEGEQK